MILSEKYAQYAKLISSLLEEKRWVDNRLLEIKGSITGEVDLLNDFGTFLNTRIKEEGEVLARLGTLLDFADSLESLLTI